MNIFKKLPLVRSMMNSAHYYGISSSQGFLRSLRLLMRH